MKRARLIPSILMLVLCTAVLAVGIYAASPTSHSVVGTVKISAGGANVRITAYLDDGDGDYKDDVKVSDTYTSRTAQTINIYANAIDFDCSSAFDISEVAEKKLYFKVDNLSNYSLGAYFLEGTVPESGTMSSNIAESKNFDGTIGTTTITNLITATFTEYTEVPGNDSAYMYSILKLNQLNSEASTVTLSLNLNIEKYNSVLGPATIENAITIKTGDNSVSVKCSINNSANDVETTFNVSNTYVWNSGGVAFADDMYLEQYRLPTIYLNIEVTNTNDYPIKAIVKEGTNNGLQDNIEVTTTSNWYIPAGEVGIVTIQFSAVYDRGVESVTTIPEVGTYCYGIVIGEVDEVSSNYIYDLIIYDDDTTEWSMPYKGFNYYIEFGDNPYYNADDAQEQGASYIQRQKLRWYVWAKDDGKGNPIPLESGDKITDNTSGIEKKKLAKGNIYYFISEYVLDVSAEKTGLCLQNEYTEISSNEAINIYGDDASDYSGSNIRNYLNGLTVKNDCVRNSSYNGYIPNGDNVNFLEKYKLTNDVIYSLIIGRSLDSIYNVLMTEDNGYVGDEYKVQLPTNENISMSDEDKFWLLSVSEMEKCMLTSNHRYGQAYWLSSGNQGGNMCWLLSTPNFSWGCTVGDSSGGDVDWLCNIDYGGVRPAFKLEIL